jgi:hypothetical protein
VGYVGILLLFLLALANPLAALLFLAAALAFVGIVTDAWGLRRRLRWAPTGLRARDFWGTVVLLVGAVSWGAGIAAAPTPERTSAAVAPTPGGAAEAPAPEPTPRPPTAAEATRTAAAQATAGAAPLAEAARAEAVELLGQAVAQREAGQLGLALELGRQALGKAPGSPAAQSFLATVQPQATAQAREAATAQAQDATAARQQATAQALAAATAEAAANLQIVSVSSPASRNSTATVRIRTVPGARCGISVQYSTGFSTAAGLTPKDADASGAVSWSWQIGPNTAPGPVPVSVSCSSGDRRWDQRTILVVS